MNNDNALIAPCYCGACHECAPEYYDSYGNYIGEDYYPDEDAPCGDEQYPLCDPYDDELWGDDDCGYYYEDY